MEEIRYTQADLLREARGLGYDVSQGTLERYVSLGLIDRATARGRGRGRGVDWTWPEQQRRLWLTLLQHRDRTSKVRSLANVPVSIWLLWGDEYVPLQQVRKALETWGEVEKPRRRHDYPAMALRWVNELAKPDAGRRDREDLVAALVDAARTRQFDHGYIGALVKRVVGPSDPTAEFDGARAMLLLEAQWITTGQEFHGLSDDVFRWARAMYLVTRAGYERVKPQLASGKRLGQFHDERTTFELLVNTACQDLMLILGLALTRPDAPGLPEALRLERWTSGQANLRTSTSVGDTALLLPDGRRDGRLRVEVEIVINEVHEPTT